MWEVGGCPPSGWWEIGLMKWWEVGGCSPKEVKKLRSDKLEMEEMHYKMVGA